MTDTLTAVITGASQGIGLEVARQLLEQDIHVIVTARSQTAVDQALGYLGTDGSRVVGQVIDVADASSVDAFFSQHWRHHERLDILINNAARVYGNWQRSGIEDTEASTVLEALNNNTLGAYRMIRHVLPAMNRIGYGRIVNVSSGMAGLTEMGGDSAAYRISKTALNALTRVAHAEAGSNVKVNSVCPGWVRTQMGGQTPPGTLAKALPESSGRQCWRTTAPPVASSGTEVHSTGEPLCPSALVF